MKAKYLDTLFFEDIEELIDIMDPDDQVIVPYEMAADMIAYMLREYGCYLDIVDIRSYNPQGHDAYVFSFDEEGGIYCEPMWRSEIQKNVILENVDGGAVYVYEDIPVSTLDNSDDVEYFVFSFDDEFDREHECDGDCVHCTLADVEQHNTYAPQIATHEDNYGITQSWSNGRGSYYSRSFYSSDTEQMNKVKNEWERFAHEFR